MAITTLLTPKRRTLIQTNLGNQQDGVEQRALEIDAVPRRTHEFTSTVTSHPVESGLKISDTIIFNNKKLTLDGMISNTPIGIFQSLGGLFGAAISTTNIGAAVGVVAGNTIVSLLQDEGDRVQNALKFLTELYEDGIPFTVVTKLRTYNDVVLTNLQLNETPETSNTLNFTATFEEIKVTFTNFVEVPPEKVSTDIEKDATTKVNTGKQETPTPSPATSLKTSISGGIQLGLNPDLEEGLRKKGFR